jgi:formylglycine-generating enzyme required for sulfatase activity
MPIRRAFASSAAALLACAHALAGGPFGDGWRPFRDANVQDHGHHWSRVGDPHNANAVIPPQFPWEPARHVGRVDYKYRMMTREVTVGEWYEFVQAYAPHYEGPANDSEFTGIHIVWQGSPGGVPQYRMVEGTENRPVAVGWRYAARYANWLTHDKALDAAAFESGAYDTSTFGWTKVGDIPVFTDQRNRSEGAQFWIPSFDEWTKAGHWDPDRYGEDQGGWWLFPTTSDTAPVSAEPDMGGETNGGPFPPGQVRPLDVASYPHIQSPWGLLDVSGGASEWSEDINHDVLAQRRSASGTGIYQPGALPSTWDILGAQAFPSPTATFGVRLASVIPAPATMVVLTLAIASMRSRRYS